MADVSKPKVKTEEEIRAYTLGELKPLIGPIVLVDHDPEWALSFEGEAKRLRDILGARVKVLEHVGSTSVVGLPAKPIIDLVLAVARSEDEASYVPELEANGYVLRVREPAWFEHRLFKGPDADINLHVFSVGCPEISQMLLFRDRLRSFPAERDEYAARKRELARMEWRFVQNYADAKTEIVHQILARARGEREALGL
jgi:GrpB-like predicted nucleotidyltransferase (UPF0157 family)